MIKSTDVQREAWVDQTKTIACILVVLGHFFQSMTRSNILPTSHTYNWFNQTIYYFHVPLFFICSGYLYQKFSNIHDISSWKHNIGKKLLALGIPYFVFSFLTWVLKVAFASSVNIATGNLWDTLFLTPLPPYWYLYILFLLFLITPTFQSKKTAYIYISVALLLKIILMVTGELDIYAISKVMDNEIWFVLGMLFSMFSYPNKSRNKNGFYISIFLFLLFIPSSIFVYVLHINNAFIGFILGLTACISIITFLINRDDKQVSLFTILSPYTMPIFLMHTIFAAPLRSILLKIGISNAVLQVCLGLLISFLGPIFAAKIMSKVWFLDFLIYPTKHLKK